MVEASSTCVCSYWCCLTLAAGLRYNYEMSVQSLDRNPVECAWNLYEEMGNDVKAGQSERE